MVYGLALIGALLGSLLGINGGFLLGAALGFGAAILWRQNTTLKTLQERIDSLEYSAIAGESEAGARSVEDEEQITPEAPSAAPAEPEQAAPTGTVPARPAEPRSVERPTVAPQQPAAAPPLPPRVPAAPPQPSEPPQPSALDQGIRRLSDAVVRFATTGNPVVRIGAVVLFIGVAYLLRYAYEHSMVPVELRLAGAGIGGIALLVFGWRLRDRADTYGLILQGAGVAILYLTVFASARLYELLPMSAAFASLVVLVAGASVLAVVQKSQALAIFSMSGGFLAPILTSTGEGSHVALFSYYAMLNAGILGMAWFRHWRWLNWTGFVFTFVIGASWGYQYYEPRHFATTEPFLILFFLFYLGVSLLFARRREVELKGVVDGTMVFGMPVVAFALQAALVQDMPFGLAFSALGAAMVYTGLALWLRRRGHTEGLLDRSFVALAVVFATLAIPFAFDNQRFTAATWALEGAGMSWVGLRQAQLLPRAFGLLLQLGAGFAFAVEYGRPEEAIMFLNSAFLGAAFLGLAAVFTASQIGRQETFAATLHRFEPSVGWALLAWGVLWWHFGGAREFSVATPGEGRFEATNIGEHLFLVYMTLSLALLTYAGRRFRWPEGLQPGFLLLPAAVLVMLGLDIGYERGTALADLGWVAWPLAFTGLYWHLEQVGEKARLAAVWHTGCWWFLTLFITWNAVALVGHQLDDSVWAHVLWGAVPLAACTLLLKLGELTKLEGRAHWPFKSFPQSYFGWGWAIALGYLLVWVLISSQLPGNPSPLPYVVLINPLELVQAGVLLLGIIWARKLKDGPLADIRTGLLALMGGAVFVWINFVAIRAVHFYAGVSYPAERVAESDAFQTLVTILWTIIAFALMGFGTRRVLRLSWLVGAGLLAVVILKLFLVDMGNLDLVGRIVSFITVGVLMLVIGYFAPIPPKRAEASDA